ncbi:polycomb group ring finger 3-like lethal (3) 73Ah [Dermatophagoides pteronyssinus]|uniref:Polycomb group RING finger protein 3 n=2 Tax=Dermatophagoides pteronyssinus TaxID=6956 RepID=A0ABQ8JPJ8_DERPT|nr:polycomb group RING finger protein 3-like [Dermatophagoides pteronyssinus]KAH9424535.1 Polycomb group RING finger protein 3 [Dermatophagoides pteronyssinus]
MERRIKLKSLNPYITCKICKGYLIDATTVTECLHTFCKSCLVKHLEENNTCPTCNITIHQSHPLQYISYDRTLQDVVYKLVPNLQQNEIEREREFYRSRVMPYPKSNPNLIKMLKDGANLSHQCTSENYHRDDEQIGIELLTSSEELLKQIKAKYIRCSSQLTINHLKKFISKLIFKTTDKHKDIDILYNEELLGKDHTLKFVFVTRWRFKSGPLKLYYKPSLNLIS